MIMMMDVIIDTDCAYDDSLAITLLLLYFKNNDSNISSYIDKIDKVSSIIVIIIIMIL